MKKSLCFLFILLCIFSSFAQKTIVLKGKILKENSQSPIESATIYLIRSKDSSVVNYTISDKNGYFKLDVKKTAEKVILKVSDESYQDFSQDIEKNDADKDFGVLYLPEKINKLDEVVVKSMTPPVRVKKDTLEFNAASFKVRPDGNVLALIKELPGAQIDENNKITINGKEVNKILVNGKPFFSEDGKIALQNLSADMIKKVQVSNTKTKDEEINKQESSSNNSTINLTLKEDKNKGFFGKFMGGYGTDNRYETSGIASYFKNKRRITAIVSSNNINASGFSMDDVFDNMGGGRNRGNGVVYVGGYGGGTGNSDGITRSSSAGLNYTDEWSKGLNSFMSYNYNNSDRENRNKTAKADFLPSGNIFTESESINNQLNEAHKVDIEFEYVINEKNRIYMTPNLSKGSSTGNQVYQSVSRDDNGELLNENSNKTNTKSDSKSFQNAIGFNRTFDKKGRYFGANMRNYYSNNMGNSLNNSATLFYQNTTPDDIRNQNALVESTNNSLNLNIIFSEPISDSLAVAFAVGTNLDKMIEDNNTFDFDATSGKYSNRNEQLSNYFDSKSTQFSPNISFIIRKSKLFMRAKIGTYFIDQNNNSNYLDTKTNLSKNYIFPEGTFQLSYRFSNTKSIYVFYDRQFGLPSASQLLPIENLSNPLNTIVGNSDLDLARAHVTNVYFNSFNTSGLSGISANSSFNYNDSQIVSTTVYDNNGKQSTTYTNISGIYNLSLGGDWNKTFKKDLHTFKYSLGVSSNYQLQKGFTNGVLFSAQIISMSPRASISYDYGEFFTLRPFYNFTYSKTNYDNYSIEEASNRLHNFKIEATNYFHKKWVFGNDFGYNYNSDISGGFKKDFYLWNTSLSYKTKDDQWIFKVKVYDILDQNQSATRSISATSIVDAQNTVLKRYGMFSLTYKFKKFGTKLEEEKPNEKATVKVN